MPWRHCRTQHAFIQLFSSLIPLMNFWRWTFWSCLPFYYIPSSWNVPWLTWPSWRIIHTILDLVRDRYGVPGGADRGLEQSADGARWRQWGDHHLLLDLQPNSLARSKFTEWCQQISSVTWGTGSFCISSAAGIFGNDRRQEHPDSEETPLVFFPTIPADWSHCCTFLNESKKLVFQSLFYVFISLSEQFFINSVI